MRTFLLTALLLVVFMANVGNGQKPDDCWNNYPCCDTWRDQGFCQSKFQFMRLACPVSCGLCRPSYRPSEIGCLNHFSDCNVWAGQGYCRGKQRDFMAENCRQACNMCRRAKNVQCVPPPPLECYNDDPCCAILVNVRGCRDNYVQQYCRRECGICEDKIDEYSDCMDFFPMCQYKAKHAACEQSSKWMFENCKAACGKCDILLSTQCRQNDHTQCGTNERCVQGQSCDDDCQGNRLCSRNKRETLMGQHLMSKRQVSDLEATAWAPPAAPPPPVSCKCRCKPGYVRQERDENSPCIPRHQCRISQSCGRNEECTRDPSRCDKDCDGNRLCSRNKRQADQVLPLAPPPPANCTCRCKRSFVRRERDDSSPCVRQWNCLRPWGRK